MLFLRIKKMIGMETFWHMRRLSKEEDGIMPLNSVACNMESFVQKKMQHGKLLISNLRPPLEELSKLSGGLCFNSTIKIRSLLFFVYKSEAWDMGLRHSNMTWPQP